MRYNSRSTQFTDLKLFDLHLPNNKWCWSIRECIYYVHCCILNVCHWVRATHWGTDWPTEWMNEVQDYLLPILCDTPNSGTLLYTACSVTISQWPYPTSSFYRWRNWCSKYWLSNLPRAPISVCYPPLGTRKCSLLCDIFILNISHM